MSRTYDEVRRHEGGMGLQEKPMYRRKLEVEGAFLALLLEPKILILEEFDFLDQSRSRILPDNWNNLQL